MFVYTTNIYVRGNMRQRVDLSGQKFGRLTVIEFVYSTSRGQAYYKCMCECGVEKIIRSSNFVNGSTISCGCYQKNEKNKWLRSKMPHLISAKRVWQANYGNGCSFEIFLKLTQQNCYYCTASPMNKINCYSNRMKKGTISKDWFDKCWWTYNGLDRIDSSKPHTEDNIVPCCKFCNQAKNDMTTEEFKNWIKRIYKNFVGEEK